MFQIRYFFLNNFKLFRCRAAVSIQRFYRDRKGYPNPPPCSPTLQYQDNLYQSLSSIRLDYETYLRLRRSRHKSTLSVKSLPYRLAPVDSSLDKVFNIGVCDQPIHRHISVDLKKLEGQTTEILNKASMKSGSNHKHIISIPEKISPSLTSYFRIPSIQFEEDTPVRQVPENLQEIAARLGVTSNLKGSSGVPRSAPIRIGKYYTQYAFLGQVDTKRTQDFGVKSDDTAFRLTVRKPDVITQEPLEELIMRTVEGADDIRAATKEIDRKAKSAPLPVLKRNPTTKVNHLQRSLIKSHTGMNFSAFRAVEKAYKDREQAEKLLRKSHVVKQIKKQEKSARTKVKRTKRNHKNEACAQKRSDRARVLQELESRRIRMLETQDQTAMKRNSREESQRRAKDNYRFALDFSCQNASVGKALVSHEYAKRRNDTLDRMTRRVGELRSDNLEKKTILREFNEQKMLIKQTDVQADRADLDMKLMKNSAKRELELREHLKKHQEKELRQLRSPTLLAVTEIQSRNVIASP